MIGKTDIPDCTGLFFLFDPVDDSDRFELLPHGQVCQMMHQIIVYIVSAQPCQLLVEILVQPLAVFDHILREFGRDIDLFPYVIPFKDFTDGGLAPGINICGVKVVDTGAVGSQDFLLGFFDIDTVSFSCETHTAEAEHGQIVPVSILPVEHSDSLLQE